MALLVIMIATAAQSQPAERPGPAAIGAREAHAKALAGEIVLIDIRTPDEWRETGVAASAHAITMHQDQAMFLRQLGQAVGGSRQRPIALICARGNRSAVLQAHLRQAGFDTVIDVAEGMVGNRRGTGWLPAGLPVRRWVPGLDSPP